MSRIIDALAKVENVEVRTQFDGKYQVCFADSWMLDGAGKIGIYGVGNTSGEAARDYLQKIGGHRIVVERENIKTEYFVVEVNGGEKHGSAED